MTDNWLAEDVRNMPEAKPGKKQTTVRMGPDTLNMMHKLGERQSKPFAQVLSEAILLMWLLTGGGKYEIDPDIFRSAE